MQTCPITTLRRHSEGVKYAPVLVAGVWQLQSTLGDVLTGYRGKVYEFLSEKNAKTWLCTNLSRSLNAIEPTPIDFMLQLGQILLETGASYVQQEIENIDALNKGVWQPVECAGATEIVIIEAQVDYDGGNAEGLIF